MQTQNPVQAPPALDSQKMLKMQFFAKFTRDCELLLQDNPSAEAGIARCKLQEANFWATMAITKEQANNLAPMPIPPSPPIDEPAKPVVPISPAPAPAAPEETPDPA